MSGKSGQIHVSANGSTHRQQPLVCTFNFHADLSHPQIGRIYAQGHSGAQTKRRIVGIIGQPRDLICTILITIICALDALVLVSDLIHIGCLDSCSGTKSVVDESCDSRSH